MKAIARFVRGRVAVFLVILTLPAALQAQFSYSVDQGKVTITRYTGPGGDVIIPETTEGLPVTSIGFGAFWGCTGLTGVTIPDSVTRIEGSAFYSCPNLTSVTIGNSVTSIGDQAFALCRSLTGVTIPSSVTTIGWGAFSSCSSLTKAVIGNGVTSIASGILGHCTSLTSITIPNSVTSIGRGAFTACSRLTNITVPESVTRIGVQAFWGCTSLTSVYFEGNAPEQAMQAFEETPATLHHLPGTAGWGPEYSGRPTALWARPNPTILDFGPSFGVQPNGFGFRIAWATNANVVVEASMDLANPTWSPVSTNTLTDGWVDFTDPDWAQHPARFYRVRGE